MNVNIFCNNFSKMPFEIELQIKVKLSNAIKFHTDILR